MKISFDAKRAAQNKTGLGNYSRFVIDGLCKYFPYEEYGLYIPNKSKASLVKPFEKYSSCSFYFPIGKVWEVLSGLWRISAINRQLRSDMPAIFHGLSNELPIGIEKINGMKTVVTIHDLIFLRYPEFYSSIDRNIYKYKFKRACEVANSIIAVSECTKRDIIDFFGISPQKIKVIYQGCDDAFKKQADNSILSEVKSTYNIPDKYILYVGSIESRKNLLLAVKALKYTKSNISLIAVGKRTPYADSIKKYISENNLSSRVHFLHNVPFRHLPALYQMSSLFVYPSLFEGFGIPILEALNSKIPVIAATGSCLEEAGGPHSIYINPYDVKSMAESIDNVLSNATLRDKMISEGLNYAKRFEQKILTEEMMNHYTSLLS